MNQFYLKNLVLAIAITAFLSANAQPFHLVRDINSSTDGNPSNFPYGSGLYSAYPSYAVFNGVAYFSADDGVHGTQLWCSDGTTAGTRLVKVVAPGVFAAQIVDITSYAKGVVFYVSYNSTHELWVSDGTDSGTQKIKDLPLGYSNSPPSQFTLLNGNLYFVNSYNLYEDQLWRTDGTGTGTVLVADCYTSSYDYGYELENLTVFKGLLYFSLTNNSGSELWQTNGSATGTDSVFNFGESGYISNLTVLNDTLYFAGPGSMFGNSLWKSDGTNSGTSTIPSSQYPYLGVGEGEGQPFQIIKNTLYFLGNGVNLYKYNPKDPSGITFVVSMDQNAPFDYITNFFSFNDSLLFLTCYDSLFNEQLWCSNGTAGGTILLKSVPATYTELFPNFYATKNTLYFSCYADGNGYELYATDGSMAGTRIVKDINPGIYSSNPACFTQIDPATLIFSANDGVTGDELWKTDGTANGTALVKDINQLTTASSSPALFYPGSEYLALNNGQMLFGARDDMHGYEPWKTDGTTGGTFLVKDVLPGYFSGFNGTFNGEPTDDNSLLTPFNNAYYFFGESLGDTVPLVKTDGTLAGTTMVQNLAGGIRYNSGDQIQSGMVVADSLLYFATKVDFGLGQLWVSNGHSPANLLRQNIPFSFFGTSCLFAAGSQVFFMQDDGNFGSELWKTDGTVAGTQMAKDINPGTEYSTFYPVAYNNKLYFELFDGTSRSLWVSDGTPAGTLIIKQLNIINTIPFIISGNKFYFDANTDSTGTELWASDGTTAGTYQVKDIYPRSNSSYPTNMVDVNGTLFFTAYDGVHGNEIWKTDGTDSGTVMVKDITPGIGSTYPEYMVNYNGRLCCVINDTIWQSNGSAAGTLPVTDASLNGLGNIQGLAVSGNNLYFSAYTYQYGTELYVGQINTILPVTLLSFTGQWDKKDAVLNWKTTNEINNKYFNVQRSLTGSGFANVGQAAADAGLSQNHDYSFTDVNAANLATNSVFYRLQQVDLNGNFAYSNIVRLNISGNSLISIAPNPAQKTAYITSSVDIAGAVIIIADMGGRVISIVRQNLAAGSPAPINISGLTAGVYNITVQGNNQVKLQSKLVVQ